jgi:type IV pilus assembly protein PilY1
MWTFDLDDADPANWTDADASLLYVAQDGLGNRQPIINSPEVTLHPTAGNMVLFGTGKFLETGDTTSTSVQSFYGVQDNGSTVSGRGELSPQTIGTIFVAQANPLGLSPAPADVEYRTVTAGCGASPLPACPTTSKGWYVDLPTPGERSTGTARLVSGNIFFNTFIPSTSPCEFGGTGWLMALNYLTGAMPTPGGAFDTNNDGVIDSLDTPVAGVHVGAALGGTTPISGSGGSTTGVGVSSTTDGNTPTTLINFGAGSKGRINWREIVQ